MVLNSTEYTELVECSLLASRNYSEEFLHILEAYNNSQYWDGEIHGLNYFLSMILDRFVLQGKEIASVIDLIYDIQETRSFHIEEGSVEFIEELFVNSSGIQSNIEERLVAVKQSFR
jgi:hypothetical protein